MEGIILGTIQGITEWLPISSEGVIVLVKTNFFGGINLDAMIRLALFLHLGTVCAALVYFWKDIVNLLGTLLRYKKAEVGQRKILLFLATATFMSGALGFLLLKTLEQFGGSLLSSGRMITLFVGIMLLVTSYFILKGKKSAPKEGRTPSFKDSVILGIAQGFAAIPGISRSGITVSSLLLLGFSETQALRLSFLLSIPIVLAGNVMLNLSSFEISQLTISGLIFSFIFGLITIHYFLKAAEKINFGYFALIFGILMISSIFI